MSSPVNIKQYTVILLIAWTLLIIASFSWFYVLQKDNYSEIAKAEARMAFQKDTLYRKWASEHGGVYVPVTGKTPPNPYLSHIPERDITTPSGKALTLVNPAYMTRQVFEMADKEKFFTKGHITSLNPIRHENAPDPWEREALQAFSDGTKEVSGIQMMNGQQYIRLMRPFIVEQSCLKCHASQGYKLGDIRGGISVSVPLSLFSETSGKLVGSTAATHGIIWFLGVTLIGVGSRKLSGSYAALRAKNMELENEVAEREQAQEGLQEQALLLEEEVAERQHAQEELSLKSRQLEQELVVRRQAEAAMQELNTFYTQIITSAREGIVVYDKDLRYIAWNPYMEELTGFKADEVLGKYPLELFPFLKDVGVMERLERVLAGEITDQVDFPFSNLKSGKTGYTSDLSSALRNKDGEIIGVIGNVRNISEHKKLEEQLHHAQKMEAIGRLAGGVAHDFNNILTVIGGYCSIMQIGLEQEGRLREMVDQIAAAAERASNLTRSLLAFSHKTPIKPSPANLNDIVSGVSKFLRRIIGEDVALKTHLQNDPLNVYVDSGQIEQVLMNLATNARDAMPEGGTLTIETSRLAVDTAFVKSHGVGEAGLYAVMTVTDTGIGMNEETRNRIFDPFYTTKEAGKGTGLGMSIVHGVISQHNGFINVYSEPAVGTTFKVFLPIISGKTASWETSERRAEMPSGTETILVVEDDEHIRDLVGNILVSLGYNLIIAVDGQDGVNKFTAHKDSIQFVLMDIIMPNKNGWQAGVEIRRLKPGMKILFMSGYPADTLSSQGSSLGNEESILKPFNQFDLASKIRSMLDEV